MEKQKAQPQSTPNLSVSDQPQFPFLMAHLSLSQKTASNQCIENDQNKIKKNKGFGCDKTKHIEKKVSLKRSYKKQMQPQKKQNYKKKVVMMQSRIEQLQAEVDRLKRKMQGCPQCRYYSHKMEDDNHKFDAYMPNYEQQMKKLTGNMNQSRGSINSVQFQTIDFNAPMMASRQIDDKAWVYTGILMIAIGSKCLQVDGTINVFRVLKQSVDTLRRQVQKSQPNISMDFYLTQQQMKQNQFMQDIGFDPFTQKISGETGLALQGIKVQSVQQFQLIYDNKLTYNIKYQALLGAMEYLRQNSWLTF